MFIDFSALGQFTKVLVNRLPFPFFVCSQQEILACNSVMCDASGYTEQELQGSPLSALISDSGAIASHWMSPTDDRELQSTAKLLIKSGKAVAFQLLAWRSKLFEQECVAGILLPLKQAEMSSEANEARERIAELSDRQREVFDLAVSGVPNKSIAQRLNISVKTVEMHRSQLMKKLQTPNLAALVRLAVIAEIYPEE